MLDKSTHIGLGYATHSDAFQCGREAAQIAKNQLPEGPVDLVMIFGPGTAHFKDFVEGVRLVMGEETLVAIPSERVLTNESSVADTCFVAALQMPGMRVSIASSEIEADQLLRGTTALISQFRRHRGNAFREFPNRGCLVFSHGLSNEKESLSRAICADMGLDSWMMGAATMTSKDAPLICTNRSLSHGLVGIEFMSAQPWGVGSVTLESFSTRTDVVREAVKTALRDAHGQMQGHKAAFGLVFFDWAGETSSPLPNDILKSAATILPTVPLIGISTNRHFVRRPNRSVPTENDFVVAMLVPV